MTGAVTIVLERKAAYPLRQPPDDLWRRLHRIAAAAEPAVRKQFLAAVEQLLADIDTDALDQALAAEDLDGVLRAIPFDALHDALAAMEDALDQVRERSFELGSGAAEPHIDTEQLAIALRGDSARGSVAVAFGQTSEAVLEAIRDRAAERVTQVTAETRAAIRQLVERAYRDGIGPRQITKDIRAQIGLTTRQQAAVDRYRASLEDEDVAPAKVDRLVDRYVAKLLKQRATLIARTETLQAMNDGQRASWATLAERGLIDAGRMEREWMAIVPNDGRTCPVCEALDGARAPIGGSYGSVGGVGPPQHPDCRCTERLVPIERHL